MGLGGGRGGGGGGGDLHAEGDGGKGEGFAHAARADGRKERKEESMLLGVIMRSLRTQKQPEA